MTPKFDRLASSHDTGPNRRPHEWLCYRLVAGFEAACLATALGLFVGSQPENTDTGEEFLLVWSGLGQGLTSESVPKS